MAEALVPAYTPDPLDNFARMCAREFYRDLPTGMQALTVKVLQVSSDILARGGGQPDVVRSVTALLSALDRGSPEATAHAKRYLQAVAQACTEATGKERQAALKVPPAEFQGAANEPKPTRRFYAAIEVTGKASLDEDVTLEAANRAKSKMIDLLGSEDAVVTALTADGTAFANYSKAMRTAKRQAVKAAHEGLPATVKLNVHFQHYYAH